MRSDPPHNDQRALGALARRTSLIGSALVCMMAWAAGPVTAATNGRIFFTAPNCGVASIAALSVGFSCVEVGGRAPRLSPDGRRVAWNLGDSPNEVWTMNPDGSHPRQLTHSRAESLGSFDQTWSPDSRLIAYSKFGSDDAGVHVMNADGSHDQLLAPNAQEPAFAPDGKTIVFAGNGIQLMDGGGGNMRLLLPDRNVRSGTSPSNFTTLVERNLEPRFSPDGRRIVFSRWTTVTTFTCLSAACVHSTRDVDVYTMSADGSGVRRLTSNSRADESNPSYSPDGKKIVFSHLPVPPRDPSGSPEENGQVYAMNSNGSGQHLLFSGSNAFWSSNRGGPGRALIPPLSGLPRGCARKTIVLHGRIVTSAPRLTDDYIRVQEYLDGRRRADYGTSELTSGDNIRRLRDVFYPPAVGFPSLSKVRRGRHTLKFVVTIGSDFGFSHGKRVTTGPETVTRTAHFSIC